MHARYYSSKFRVSYTSPCWSFRVVFNMEAGYSNAFDQPGWPFLVASQTVGWFWDGSGCSLGLGVGRDKGIWWHNNLLFLTRIRSLRVLMKYHWCGPMSITVPQMSHLFVLWFYRATFDFGKGPYFTVVGQFDRLPGSLGLFLGTTLPFWWECSPVGRQGVLYWLSVQLLSWRESILPWGCVSVLQQCSGQLVLV